ncbi:hypothetical protein ACRALDRAFT_206724 [Sodiomyces alcalophilus JCM 7366]|uniref:uncharacterized protein n=1 Tax=Sodiomyces alcalophilus JCM 7366 TaxID=591952 RepID=UPI0039B4E005
MYAYSQGSLPSTPERDTSQYISRAYSERLVKCDYCEEDGLVGIALLLASSSGIWIRHQSI